MPVNEFYEQPLHTKSYHSAYFFIKNRPFFKMFSTDWKQSNVDSPKIFYPNHELIILTKFHNNWVKIVDFLIKAYFGVSLTIFWLYNRIIVFYKIIG